MNSVSLSNDSLRLSSLSNGLDSITMKDRTRFGNRRGKAKPRSNSIKFTANSFVTSCADSFYEHYDLVEKVGEGAYGEVYVCEHKESGDRRAVKILDVSSERQYDVVLNEFSILKGLDHPNLLKIYHLYEDSDGGKCYIVSDLYDGGELFDEIEEYGCLEEESAAIMMNQLLSCINYLHSQGIAHRDLKPENILLADEDMRLDAIKVIDFGLSALFDDYENDRFTDQVGSAYYIAPEVLRGNYGPKCDVWSCGVIAFVLMCGDAPFYGESEHDVLDMVIKGEFSFEDNEIWKTISPEAMDFVEWLLSYNEGERPTAKEALRHPWLKRARRLSSLGLKERDSQRMSQSLSNLEDFNAESKLKQAVFAFMSSQLIMIHEKDEIDELFRALDSNCDGRLTKDELKKGYKAFLDRDLSDRELDDISSRVNFSCSGAIEYSEFVVACMKQKNLLDETRLRAAFNEFDQGSKGYLTEEDLSKALGLSRDSGARRTYTLNKIMKQIDTNKDGSISFQEFRRAMSSEPMPAVEQFPVRSFRRRSKVNESDLRRSINGLQSLQLQQDLEKCFEPRKTKSLGIDVFFRSVVSAFSPGTTSSKQIQVTIQNSAA